jgi:hypothetical protein
LLSDILKYDTFMLSERTIVKPPERWAAHRSGAVHPAAMTTRGNFALPRKRTLCRRDACRHRVGEPLRQPRKDGAGDRVRCTLARGTGGDLLRWSRNANFSVTGKDLHRIRQYLLLIHIQRGIGLGGQDG